MNPEGLERLLQQVRHGKLSIKHALQRLRSLPYEDLGFASLDHHRSLRQGFPEVVLCEGKARLRSSPSPERSLKTRSLCHSRRTNGWARYSKSQPACTLLSRCASCSGSSVAIEVTGSHPGRHRRYRRPPVAEEARITAEVMGSRVERLYDVGVAGIHRLLGRKERLFEARVVIVVAGMDGVLPVSWAGWYSARSSPSQRAAGMVQVSVEWPPC